MPSFDFAALENIEYDAYADLYRAAPEAIGAAHDIDVTTIAGAACLTCRGIEPTIVFRRAVRLGVDRAIAEPELEEILAFMSDRCTSFAIPVAPQTKPPELSTWLEARTFTPGYAWMKFSRLCTGAIPQRDSDLEIRVVGSESASDFGHVVTEGFGLSPALVPWVGALPGRADWVCVMAFAGGSPAAAGAVYVRGDYAWLGFGATLPAYRRRGAQTALLARRLAEASARGARIAVTETGERLPDKPGNSYRNILGAGFEERYLRQNYVSPSRSA